LTGQPYNFVSGRAARRDGVARAVPIVSWALVQIRKKGLAIYFFMDPFATAPAPASVSVDEKMVPNQQV
jgi:hypothetical protein